MVMNPSHSSCTALHGTPAVHGKADQRESDGVNTPTVVAADYTEADDDDEGIHRDPLIPAEGAWRQIHDLTKEQTAYHSQKGDRPRRVGQQSIEAGTARIDGF